MPCLDIPGRPVLLWRERRRRGSGKRRWRGAKTVVGTNTWEKEVQRGSISSRPEGECSGLSTLTPKCWKKGGVTAPERPQSHAQPSLYSHFILKLQGGADKQPRFYRNDRLLTGNTHVAALSPGCSVPDSEWSRAGQRGCTSSALSEPLRKQWISI